MATELLVRALWRPQTLRQGPQPKSVKLGTVGGQRSVCCSAGSYQPTRQKSTFAWPQRQTTSPGCVRAYSYHIQGSSGSSCQGRRIPRATPRNCAGNNSARPTASVATTTTTTTTFSPRGQRRLQHTQAAAAAKPEPARAQLLGPVKQAKQETEDARAESKETAEEYTASATAAALPPPPKNDTESLPAQEEHLSLPAPEPPRDDPIPVANNVPSLPLWQRLGPLTWAADSYARYQRKRPYWTQLISGLIISVLADLSVQRMNSDRESYSPVRTLRSIIIGGISAIPTYRWVVYLSHNFNYASRTLSLGTKVIVNQLVYTPIFNSYFFFMHATLAGEPVNEAVKRVIRTVPISFTNSVKVWPAVTAFSFAFIPLEYRSIFSGIIAVAWQTYLVFLNRRDENTQVDHRKAVGAVSSTAGSEAAVEATVVKAAAAEAATPSAAATAVVAHPIASQTPTAEAPKTA